MSREKRKKNRKRRQKARATRVSSSVKAPLTEADRRNAIARFANLRGQGGVTLGFAPLGPRVRASSPEELEEATNRALADETLEQDPS